MLVATPRRTAWLGAFLMVAGIGYDFGPGAMLGAAGVILLFASFFKFAQG